MLEVAFVEAVRVAVGVLGELPPTLEEATPMQVSRNKKAKSTVFCVRNLSAFLNWVFTSVFPI
jgi:hypothetical protein